VLDEILSSHSIATHCNLMPQKHKFCCMLWWFYRKFSRNLLTNTSTHKNLLM